MSDTSPRLVVKTTHRSPCGSGGRKSRRTEDHGGCRARRSWWLQGRDVSSSPPAHVPWLGDPSSTFEAGSTGLSPPPVTSPVLPLLLLKTLVTTVGPTGDPVSRVKTQFCRLASLPFALSPDVATGSGRWMSLGSVILWATEPFNGLHSLSVSQSLFLIGLSWDPSFACTEIQGKHTA